MACRCSHADDFCARCERLFVCGTVGEPCPVDGCAEWRTQDKYHDADHAAFNRDVAPERFYEPRARGVTQ